MFWAFLLIVASGFVLAKLGAYSVWYTVLSSSLLAVATVAFALVGYLVWSHIRGNRCGRQTERLPRDLS